MSDIDRIVKVTITRQTAVPTIASFDNIMIAAEFLTTDVTPAFAGRTKAYGNLNDIGTEFGTTTLVYRAASKVFAQNPSVDQIYVGRKLTGIEGTEIWSDALTAMNNEDGAWYGVVVVTRTLADQQNAADWVEANKKLLGLASNDAQIIDGTGDIVEYLNTNSYDRSFGMYNATSDLSATDRFPESAWLGVMFPKDPGAATWKFKTLSGVIANGADTDHPALITGQLTTLFGKKGNTYNLISGISITENGTVGSGEYIDVIRGIDWLEARIQQLIYSKLIQLDKIPYTDEGIQVVISQLTSALQEAVNRGLLASYTTEYPEVANISPIDKGNRLLPDVKFVGILAGAIHKVEIQGIISL